ncbi:MAG: hypothetical protein WC654_04625 [Patescibacteria group bacterium]
MHLHIFLDLDLTLVNVFPLWQELWINVIAERLNLHADEVYARGSQIWERGDLYTLEKHLRAMDIDPKEEWAMKLRARFQSRLRAGAINYDDTAAFLDALVQHGLTRSILTFGDREYLQLKIEGLDRPAGFFREIHFTTYGEKALVLRKASKSGPVVFLDDSAHEHAQVATIAPDVHRIQIRRSDDILRSTDAHHVVSDLQEALDVILSLSHLPHQESR